MSNYLLISAIVALNLLCGFFTYGATLAYYQHEFPSLAKEDWELDVAFACGLALLGPVSFVVVMFASGFFKHGFMWIRPKKKVEQRDDYHWF